MDAVLLGFLQGLPTLVLLVVIFASLYILGKGADILVDEAVALSVSWGVPKVIIGATIISLGTTIPELTVSVFAALEGNSDLALGNAIGSIITNTSLILGVSALIGLVPVDRKMMKEQGLLQLFSVYLLSVISLPIINGGDEGRVSQFMGFVFLIILVVYTIKTIKGSKEDMEGLEEVETGNTAGGHIFKLILGMIVVIVSSKILIPSVEITASRIGIPDSIIAATLVAFGTSVPELTTSITAVRRGHGELAVGNVVGANILNILFVIGLSAAISSGGLAVAPIFFKLQIPAMLLSVTFLFLASMNKKEELNKSHGVILLLIYIGYLILNYRSY